MDTYKEKSIIHSITIRLIEFPLLDNFHELYTNYLLSFPQLLIRRFLARCPSLGEKLDKLYQQNGIRYFTSFVDQATPGFELGKRGFAVPRLTTRPCRQGDTKQTKKFPFLWLGLDLSLRFIFYSILKRTLLKFFHLSISSERKCVFLVTKSQNSGQIRTINY